jgi:DNA-binding transcriptional LysR family regulator
MNLRQIEAFRAVMATGSGTEAAKMLFITQPAISRLIADLEHHTKLALFTRKPNRLAPTAEAIMLFKVVDRAFIGLEEIRLSAEAILNKSQGSLRVVSMPVCIDSFLPTLVSQFLTSFDKVNFELESATRSQALDLVNTQRSDIGIISLAKKEEVGLMAERFCEQKAVCILPINHPLCELSEIHPRDLADTALVTQFRGSPFRSNVDAIFAKQGIVPQIAVETRAHSTVYQLVKKGVGVAIVDPMIIDQTDLGVVVKPFVPVISWDYAVVHPHSVTPSLITQSFIEILKAHFNRYP